MEFLTKQDFLSLINATTLGVVTDHNDALLEEAEGRAIEEMTAYLSVRYDTNKIFERDNRNPLLVLYLCDIILYHLHSRISPDHIPDLRKDRYRHAKDWLEKVADGFISPTLAGKATEEKGLLRYGGSLPKQNPYY